MTRSLALSAICRNLFTLAPLIEDSAEGQPLFPYGKIKRLCHRIDGWLDHWVLDGILYKVSK